MDVPAARNTLRMLSYLARRSGPVRASTMARDLEQPRSSTYQLIRVMLDEGFLVHFPEDHAYGLSSLLSEIGSSVLQTARLGRLAAPLLEKLVHDVGVPVVAHLGVLSSSDVMYVSRVQGFRAPTTVSNVGVRLPSHLTATGRAMLALLPSTQVRAIYPHRDSLVLRSGTEPRTLTELDHILTQTRTRGWATERGDITGEYSSVAASAVDHNGYPVAAIGLTFRSVAVDEAEWPRLGAAVVATANALTARLLGRS
ncbi:MAG: IclR family transcriptional regulator [Microbacteriaceae bacterium]|jgi:DNA-binding IclR family transcriptional regulator|nr:IclR family transcriptional regulator [Microbacteriaceae bacterium]